MWSERIYALLLYAYPRRFRRQFGDDMRECFRDRVQHTDQSAGSLWLRAVGDVVASASAERAVAAKE